ncbi:MAG: hypothetical protein M3Y59_22105 [Myxococcota bacterium]|nr:hypothetical protein [Myxococcota bacterium]
MSTASDVLGEQYASQFKENPSALQGLEVLFCGSSLSEFQNTALPARPDAVVLDMGQLADSSSPSWRSRCLPATPPPNWDG